MNKHAEQTPEDGIHVPFAWIWADSDARAAQSVRSDDINKIGFEESSRIVYVLEDLSPTWKAITGGGAVEDSATDSISTALTITHNTDQSPVAGFGTALEFLGDTSDKDDTVFGSISMSLRESTPSDSLTSVFKVNLPNGEGYGGEALVITGSLGPVIVEGTERGLGIMEMQTRALADETARGTDGSILHGSFNKVGVLGTTFSLLAGSSNTINAGDRVAIIASQNSKIGNDSTPYYYYGGEYYYYYTNNSAIVGGSGNFIDDYAYRSLVLGGNNNSAFGADSVAFGAHAKTDKALQVSHGGGSFAASGDAQGSQFVLRQQVAHSDASWTTLLIDSINPLTIPVDTLWAFDVLVIGATSGQAKGFAFRLEGAIENDGGTTALKGTPTLTVIDDSDDTSFNAQAVADDANDALAIQVQDTDGAGDTVRWVAHARVVEVVYA
jgi:hypothetical protein